MTDDKHKRETPPEIEVVNPRYKGATPEMVARALARHRIEKPAKAEDEET